MTREILFRGKRLDGIWEEGYYFAKPIIDFHCILSGENQYQVNPATVGQYTGLTDKHGKRIFEGDVLGGKAELVTIKGSPTGKHAMARHAVEWVPEKAEFATRQVYDSRCPGWQGKAIGDLGVCAKYYPVIGNIHDNPELLEATP